MSQTEWDETARFLYECGPPKDDTIRFAGFEHAYWVVPMVPVRWHSTTKSSVKAWEPRRPWHEDKARRVAYWLVSRSSVIAESPDDCLDQVEQFKTQREAKAEAQRLAAEEKTIALLKGG